MLDRMSKRVLPEKSVAGPVLIRDKIHKLKYKEAISSVDKCTTEDLH